jgi:hypothetical protein
MMLWDLTTKEASKATQSFQKKHIGSNHRIVLEKSQTASMEYTSLPKSIG